MEKRAITLTSFLKSLTWRRHPALKKPEKAKPKEPSARKGKDPKKPAVEPEIADTDKYFSFKADPYDQFAAALAAPLSAVNLALKAGSIQQRCKDSSIYDVMTKGLAKDGSSSSNADQAPSSVAETQVAVAHVLVGNAALRPHELQPAEQKRLDSLFEDPVDGKVRVITSVHFLISAAWTAGAMHYTRGWLSVRRAWNCLVAVCRACQPSRDMFG